MCVCVCVLRTSMPVCVCVCANVCETMSMFPSMFGNLWVSVCMRLHLCVRECRKVCLLSSLGPRHNTSDVVSSKTGPSMADLDLDTRH